MSLKGHNSRVSFSVTNCLCYDQRVLKIAKTVSDLNCDVTLIGRRSGSCCENSDFQFKVRRFRMLTRRGFFFYMFFNVRLFFFLLFHRFDLLVANDLDTLLPNFLVSRIKGIPLIYDSHEFFTGVPEIQNKPFVKWVWITIEKSIFPYLNHVMTVSNSIADEYLRLYGFRPLVIRNCAPSVLNLSGISPKDLGIPSGNLLLIYQGAGINMHRGAEELVEAVSALEGVSLFIIGSGDVILQLREMVSSAKTDSKIQFFPKMTWQELMRYTKSADAGLSLDRNTNLNYSFSLPNKLFDYLSAGIPVIAGSLPEVDKIIHEFNSGIIIDMVTPDNIKQAIVSLRDNPEILNKLKANAVIASGNITWELESEKIVELYTSILK
jgi:glycosyltransferase involved in cell wall biosynthesis